ncbi:MAG: alpha-ketoglutarate-dependent dioxygenase AlkB [Hyphomicrobiales bacterium]
MKAIRYIPAYIDRSGQEKLRDDIRSIIQRSPLFQPIMPRTGKPMSVRMSNCGSLGWVSDKQKGYRYQENHPVTSKPWPDIPPALLALWKDVSGYEHLPEACLVNFYDTTAKMGLHQDNDEQNFDAPVVSISLGDTCRFRVGGTTRDEKTSSFKLQSGDVVVMGGESRLCFHGVDRIYPGTSTLLKNGGRINLTLRRVTAPK